MSTILRVATVRRGVEETMMGIKGMGIDVRLQVKLVLPTIHSYGDNEQGQSLLHLKARLYYIDEAFSNFVGATQIRAVKFPQTVNKI